MLIYIVNFLIVTRIVTFTFSNIYWRIYIIFLGCIAQCTEYLHSTRHLLDIEMLWENQLLNIHVTAYQLVAEQSVGYPKACVERASGHAATAAAFTARWASALVTRPSSHHHWENPAHCQQANIPKVSVKQLWCLTCIIIDAAYFVRSNRPVKQRWRYLLNSNQQSFVTTRSWR